MTHIPILKKVFILGAGGQTGNHVLCQLSKSKEKYEIHAGVNAEDKEAQSNRVKQCCSEANIHTIDRDNIESMANTLKGADGVFIIPSSTDAKVRHARNYIKAAKIANVKFVLLLSMIEAENRQYLFAEEFNDIETTLEREKVPSYAILRSNLYMQNFVWYKSQIKEGKLPLPIGKNGKFAPIDVADVGRAVSAIFTDCQKHIGKTYNLTGPEALTGPQIADIFSRVYSRPVEWSDPSCNDAKNLLQNAQVPTNEVQGILEYYKVVSNGGLTKVSNDLESITGEKGTSLTNYLQRQQKDYN